MVTGVAEQQPLPMKKPMVYGHEKKKPCVFFLFGFYFIECRSLPTQTFILASEGGDSGLSIKSRPRIFIFGLRFALRPTRVGDVH